MSLQYILRRFSSITGMGNLEENPAQKQLAIDIINQAAEEIYESTDLPGCEQEIIVAVGANSQIALPPFVGELRKLRESTRKYWSNWSLRTVNPKYILPWESDWKNWRHLGYSPVADDIVNAGPLTFTIPVADGTILYVTGSTAQAQRASETITMDAIEKTGVLDFISIDSIVKRALNAYDILLKDLGGRELALIYNNFIESRYNIYDISLYPGQSDDCPDGKRLFDVLYKRRLARMEADSDTFPVDGFDVVIAEKAHQLLIEGRPESEQRAILMDAKITRTMQQKVRNKEVAQEARMNFGENKYLRVHRLIRQGNREVYGPNGYDSGF